MNAMLRGENAAVLQRMQDHGDDLSRIRPVEFTAVFVDRQAASAFAQRASDQGYVTELEETGTTPAKPWDVIATRQFSPSVEEITNAEVHLGALAEELGGTLDGWCCQELTRRS